jgi:hypothetical protein
MSSVVLFACFLVKQTVSLRASNLRYSACLTLKTAHSYSADSLRSRAQANAFEAGLAQLVERLIRN